MKCLLLAQMKTQLMNTTSLQKKIQAVCQLLLARALYQSEKSTSKVPFEGIVLETPSSSQLNGTIKVQVDDI